MKLRTKILLLWSLATALINLLMACAHAAEIVIQTGDRTTSSTGIWRNASGASMPYGSNRGLYANTGGEIETYQFATVVPVTTSYTVQIYNTCYSPRSHNVTHYLDHAQGRETFVLDQDCQSDALVGQWRTLGIYDFQANESVSLTITTEGSNNRYVGVTALRFVYNEEPTTPPPPPADNQAPNLSVSVTQLTVTPGTPVNLTASANDVEDGDISGQIQWQSSILNTNGTEFSANAGNRSFSITVSVSDSEGQSASIDIPVTVTQNSARYRRFEFSCLTGEMSPLNLTAYNSSALPSVGSMCDRYTAQVTNNDNNRTLFYYQDQGRIDGVIATYPFEAILRNVGIAPVNQPRNAKISEQSVYNFVGLQVHHINFASVNSAHLVVGQRGQTQNTIEGKNTVNGVSRVNDIGANRLVNGRADLRLSVDESGQIRAYWQLPNLTGDPANDEWILYRDSGILPGTAPNWGTGNQVIVGIITYAYYSNGLPFWGVADRLELREQ